MYKRQVVFPNEPLLEVRAPVIQGQLLESLLMNYVNLETLLASKAARMVLAADGVPDPVLRQRHGNLVEALKSLDDDTRLLVIGKQGVKHGGAEPSGGEVGDNVERVVRTIHKPVLITVGEFREPKSIMLAFDNSASTRTGVRLLADSPLFKGTPCQLHLVKVNGDDEGLDWATRCLENSGHTVVTARLEGEVEAALHQYQEEQGIDLIVICLLYTSPSPRD